MARRFVAVLEILNHSYKLAIGYVNDDKVVAIYKTKRNLSVPFKDGDIFDIGSIAEDISKIKTLELNVNNSKLNIHVNEVTLILPGYGLQVYKTRKTTNTTGVKIDLLDISNALALVKKEKLPTSNECLVDIIPNSFILENGYHYINPPIGLSSPSITIDANVFSLPNKLVENFKTVCEKAEIKVKKEVIGPVAVVNYLRALEPKYKTYVLADFGEKTTTLTFVGNNIIYATNFFSFGIDDLVDRLSEELYVTKEKATEIKDIYGIDSRKTIYNPPIVKSIDTVGETKIFTGEHVQKITNDFVKRWIEVFRGSLRNLIMNCTKDIDIIKDIPILMIGEGAKLNGLKDVMLNSFTESQVEILNFNTIGCRDPEYVTCLSAIYSTLVYKGALDDEERKFVNQVSRENMQKKDTKTNKYPELKDEL